MTERKKVVMELLVNVHPMPETTRRTQYQGAKTCEGEQDASYCKVAVEILQGDCDSATGLTNLEKLK